MSTPDSRLNAAERAALADLEAAAAAADPALAARLRGASTWHVVPFLQSLQQRVRHFWALVIGARWWGAPLAVAGAVLMVLGMSAGTPMAFVGALLTAIGLRVLMEMAYVRLSTPVERRKRRGRTSAP